MVKCADCGFITAQDGSRSLVEIDPRIRKPDGLGAVETRLPHEKMPICFATVDLMAEVPNHNTKEVHQCIRRERECEYFTPWHLGFSPKEHQEMLIQEQLTKWQANRDREDREWRERQRREDADAREKLRKDDLEWKQQQDNKQNRQFFWTLLILGVLLALCQIVAAFIPIWFK